MKLKTFVLYSCFFCITLSLRGCSTLTGENSLKLPGIFIPEEKWNTKTNLFAPSESNTFVQGDEVAVVLENLTESQVILPADFGVQIFIFSKEEKNWIEVENGMGYPEGQTVLLPKEQQPFGGLLIVLYPVIEYSDQPITMRIVVIGTIQDSQENDERVGAFVDITLTSK